MDIQTVYATLGADYNDAISRLMNERLVTKFTKKFVNDTSYAQLLEAVDNKDWPTAFRMVHTLKGVCLNLSFTKLANSAINLTEAIRGGKELTDYSLLEAVKKDYEETIEVISMLD